MESSKRKPCSQGFQQGPDESKGVILGGSTPRRGTHIYQDPREEQNEFEVLEVQREIRVRAVVLSKAEESEVVEGRTKEELVDLVGNVDLNAGKIGSQCGL